MTMPTDFTSLSLLIAAIGIAVVNIINAVSNWRQSNKLDKVDAKVDVVTGHVNSAASASVTKIDSLQNQITEMRAQLASKDQIAAVLAASVHTPEAIPVKIESPSPVPVKMVKEK